MKLFLFTLLITITTQAAFVKYIDHGDTIVKVDSSGLYLSIPDDPENPDYQEYLKWKAKGNKPEKFIKPVN